MKSTAWMGLTLAMLIVGCQAAPTNTMAVAPPATPEQIETLRNSFHQQNQNTDLGVVIEVLPSEMLAAVSGLDASKFRVGDTVCFIDSNTNPLVCGAVVRVTDTQVHVKYENPASNRRVPVRGDLAVAYH